MNNRIKKVGIVIVVFGVLLAMAGSVVTYMAQAGMRSLGAVYEAQDVTLSYDEDGNFVDRGSVKVGEKILSLLEDDWKYPLRRSNLDPNDPLVNTADELMVQYAVISYHVLHGTQTIVLEEDVEYKGEVFKAGEHTFEVNGRYWTDFDRMHPLEGPARDKVWTPTAQALLAQISAGVASDFQGQFARAMGLIIVGLGLTFVTVGGGLVWATKKEE